VRRVLAIVLHRLGQALANAAVLASLSFVFIHALPGDLALRVAAARLGDSRLTPEAIERVRNEEGLDRPLLLQYGEWMGNLMQGDLGRSLLTGRPVAEELSYHAALTLRLGLAGWLLSYAIALPLGLWAGFHPGGRFDRVTDAFAVALASLPPFLVGIALVTLFAVTLRWLPPAGFRSAAHMVLPATTLALSLAAFSVLVIRNAVVEVRSAFFMTFARLQGLSARAAFRHHGIRNAAIPVVTYAALQFTIVVDGFVVIETLFNYPGLGDLLAKTLVARDVPVIVGIGLLIGFAFAVITLAADLTCLWLDPRGWRKITS